MNEPETSRGDSSSISRSPRLERRSPITRRESDRPETVTPSSEPARDISRDADRSRPDVNARVEPREDLGSRSRSDSSRSPRTTVQPDGPETDSGPIRLRPRSDDLADRRSSNRNVAPETDRIPSRELDRSDRASRPAEPTENAVRPSDESPSTRPLTDRLTDRAVDRNPERGLDRARENAADPALNRSPRLNRDASPRDAIASDRPERERSPLTPETSTKPRSLRDRSETASVKPESLSPFTPRVESGPLPSTNLLDRSSSLRSGGSGGGWRSTSGESLPIRSATDLMDWKDRGSRIGDMARDKGRYRDGWGYDDYSSPWERRYNYGDRDHYHHHYGYPGHCGPYYPAYYAPVIIAPVVPLYPYYPAYYPYYPSSGFSFSIGSYGHNGFFSLSFGSAWPAYSPAYYAPAYYPAYYPSYYYDPFYYNPRPSVTVINNYYDDYRRPYYESYGSSYYRPSSYSYSETYYGSGYSSATTSYYDYSPGYSRYDTSDYGYGSETVTYYDDAHGYSFTEYVRSYRPYAYRPVVERHVYYYDGPRSYTRHRPTRFYFFTDLGDYRERDVPEYVEVRQRSYNEDPADVREATDPLGRAYALFAAKDYYAAIISFDDAIRKAPKDDGILFFARAQAFFAIGDYRSAYDDIVRGMDLIPDWGQIQINMYEFYDDKTEFERQLGNLKDWTGRRPEDVRSLVTLGYVQYFLQDYPASKNCLVRALAVDKNNPVAKRFLEDVIRREADEEINGGVSSESRRTS